MIQLARALTVGLIGVAITGFTWGYQLQSGLPAADDAKAKSPRPIALPPQSARPVAEAPAVSLSRGGPQRIGSVSGSHLPEHPRVEWTFPTEGDPGEPLLADGVVYVGDRRETLYAIRTTGGSILWRTAGLGLVYFSPAKRGDVIFVASKNGLTAVARSDGKVLWSCKLAGDATESSPLIIKDRIIVGDSSGTISAVDFDGRVIWQHDVLDDEREIPQRGRRSRPRTAASDGVVIFQPIFDQSRIVAIDLKAGRRRWSFQAKGGIYGEPTVTDDRVFFGTQDNQLYCLHKTRKTLLWSFPMKSRIEAGVAFQDGSIFCGSCDGRFYRVNAETGKQIWSYQTPESNGASSDIYSAPLCTEDAVYFGSFDGHLYCLQIDDGALKWRFKPVEGAEITGSPLTDGRRIVLPIRRSSKEHGQNAIVVIGEDPRRGRS
ncbi:MAG: PQQ-binding-like beta-propeller repeat protein [Isosphaerales bacterium]